MDNMKSQSELFISCKGVFVGYVHEYLPVWLETATASEIKGVKVIIAVRKHKGLKKFRPQGGETGYIMPFTQEDFRKKTMQSFYGSEFGGDSPLQKTFHCDILKYKKLRELKYSEILTNEAKTCLEHWISLKDSEKYQHLALLCLQGLYSVVKTQKNITLSTTQEAFQVVQNEKYRKVLTKPLAKVQYSKTPAVGWKSKTDNIKIINPPENKVFYEPAFYQDRMKKIMRGSNYILNWVHDKNVTSYQDNYFSKSLSKVEKAPKQSSTVIRILPENICKMGN